VTTYLLFWMEHKLDTLYSSTYSFAVEQSGTR
jgi:hypothetical protein